MSLTLPDRAAQHFIDEVLIPGWDSDAVTIAAGFDLGASPGTEPFLPVATKIEDVGARYPSLVVTFSNETSGGETSYDYLTADGPGQNRTGSLVVTARAQDTDDASGYTGDSATFARRDAGDIVVALIEAVEEICQNAAAGGASAFEFVGSQRGPSAPDDQQTNPPTRLANCTVLYGYLRRP
jgi:hypothetical protein